MFRAHSNTNVIAQALRAQSKEFLLKKYSDL
jgi:hypothetical protein